MEQEKKTKQENIVGGIVGAFLGTLVGVLCTVVIGQLGYVASISGLVMAVGALKGYELLGGSLSKKGAVISSVLVLIMTWFAHRLSWSISLAVALEADVFQCFQLIPRLLDSGTLESRAYWGDLVMLYLFTLLGAVPTILAGLRNASMPDYPASAAPAVQDGTSITASFYPGQTAWMRPLRLVAGLSMFIGLIPAIVLLLVGGFNDNFTAALVLAALGCLISAFVMMGFALSGIQLCNNAMFLLVRVSGTVWKIDLPRLNNADTYRFTKKTGALRAIRWDILNGEEQERAKASVMRAITLLSSGQVMPGSMLGMAVLPLTDLRVIKETRWGWKCAYSVANGKEKKISIPKAYPGFTPDPELEPAQAPVPARWGLAALALSLTAVLGLAGAGLGYQIDGPISASHGDPDPTPSPTQTAPPVETLDPREMFHVGEELGYSYTAVGYIQVPDGMFGHSAYVDVHVPYSAAPEYLDNGSTSTLRSAAHGMEVAVTVAYPYETARDVVDRAYAMMEEAGADLYDIYDASDTQYYEEYDIAVKQVTYFVDNQTKVRVAILYADYKQEGYYLNAAITYLPEQMDEEYPQLLAELSDAYALNLPEIPPMDEM